MTITKLIRELEKLSKKIGPRAQVVIDKKNIDTRDDLTYEVFAFVRTETIPWDTNDGNGLFTASDQERYRSVVVLSNE